MNNEKYNQIIDEAYDSYLEKMVYHPEENWLDDEDGKKTYRQLTQEEFIYKCKTDSEFSERWGLKIEERELSDEERLDWMKKNKSKVILPMRDPNVYNVEFSMDEFFRPYGVPTKLITITYNETIESYE